MHNQIPFQWLSTTSFFLAKEIMLTNSMLQVQLISVHCQGYPIQWVPWMCITLDFVSESNYQHNVNWKNRLLLKHTIVYTIVIKVCPHNLWNYSWIAHFGCPKGELCHIWKFLFQLWEIIHMYNTAWTINIQYSTRMLSTA